MEVQDVEFICSAPHSVKHREMMDQRILTVHVKAQGGATSWFQCGLGLRVAAGKKRHIMPKRTSFSVRYDTIRSVPP